MIWFLNVDDRIFVYDRTGLPFDYQVIELELLPTWNCVPL